MFLHPKSQRVAADSEESGGFGLVAVGQAQGGGDAGALELLKLAVKILKVGLFQRGVVGRCNFYRRRGSSLCGGIGWG